MKLNLPPVFQARFPDYQTPSDQIINTREAVARDNPWWSARAESELSGGDGKTEAFGTEPETDLAGGAASCLTGYSPSVWVSLP